MRIKERVAVGSPTMRLASVASLTILLILAIAAAGVAATNLIQGPTALLDQWATYRGDAERRAEGGRGPVGTLHLRWRFHGSAGFGRSPSVADGVVYAVDGIGILHAIDEATGVERWNTPDVMSDMSINGGASIAGGLVVVTFRDSTVGALDARTGTERWRTTSPLPGGLVLDDDTVYAATDGAIVALDLADGSERWRYEAPDAGRFGGPALFNELLYAGSRSGGLVAVDAETGEVRWHANTGPDATGSAVVTDGIAYLGRSGSGGSMVLSAYDAVTGSPLWSTDEPFFSPAVSDGVAYSGSSAGSVTARDTLTGEELWRIQVGGPAWPLGVADGIAYLAAAGERRIYSLDTTNGTELSRFDVDGDISDGVAVANGSVYIGTGSGSVYAIEGDGIVTDGSVLGATRQPDADGPIVTAPDDPQAAATSADNAVFTRPYRMGIPDDPSFHYNARDYRSDHAVYFSESPVGGLTLWSVERVAIDPCRAATGTVPIEPGADALVEYLRSIEQAEVGPVEQGSLGGRPAWVFDVTARGGPEGCGGELMPWSASAQWFGIGPGRTARLLVLDDDGPAFVVEIWAEDTLEGWLPKAMAIVDTLRFTGADTPAPTS